MDNTYYYRPTTLVVQVEQ